MFGTKALIASISQTVENFGTNFPVGRFEPGSTYFGTNMALVYIAKSGT